MGLKSGQSGGNKTKCAGWLHPTHGEQDNVQRAVLLRGGRAVRRPRRPAPAQRRPGQPRLRHARAAAQPQVQEHTHVLIHTATGTYTHAHTHTHTETTRAYAITHSYAYNSTLSSAHYFITIKKKLSYNSQHVYTSHTHTDSYTLACSYKREQVQARTNVHLDNFRISGHRQMYHNGNPKVDTISYLKIEISQILILYLL